MADGWGPLHLTVSLSGSCLGDVITGLPTAHDSREVKSGVFCDLSYHVYDHYYHILLVPQTNPEWESWESTPRICGYHLGGSISGQLL